MFNLKPSFLIRKPIGRWDLTVQLELVVRVSIEQSKITIYAVIGSIKVTDQLVQHYPLGQQDSVQSN